MFNLHPAYWINYKARMWRDQVYPVDVVIVINDLDKSWPDGLFIYFLISSNEIPSSCQT